MKKMSWTVSAEFKISTTFMKGRFKMGNRTATAAEFISMEKVIWAIGEMDSG